MKLELFQRLQRMILLAVTLTLFPVLGTLAASNVVAPEASTVTTAVTAPLSGPTREVVKMTASGVPEAVIKAYVQNARSSFNLTSDNLINLQGIGVSADVMTAMLTRDKILRENSDAAYASAMATEPAPQTMSADTSYPADNTGVAPDVDPQAYSGLAPYGDWNYLPDYGWGWQPQAGLAYDAYPWGLLGAGFWFNIPGRGFCWFPHSRFGFNRFGRFNTFNRFNHFNNFNRGGAFTGSRFNAGFRTMGRPAAFNRSFGVNRSFSGVRSFSPGVSHFSGRSVGGGAHFSGGHSGGMGAGRR